jgi:hypothetical protein
MFQDIENELTTHGGQAFTGAATVSAHSYQKQSAAQDLSIGRRMAILVYFIAAGAGTTHTLDAIQSTVTALTSPDVLASVSIDTDDLPADKFVEVPIPQGVMTKAHLGLQHTATGGTTTATLSAWLMPMDEIPKYKSFPKVVDAAV